MEFEPPSGVDASVADVGSFRQGSPLSRWALARYLVGRALGESISRSLLAVALLVLGLAGLVEWGAGSTFWAVVIALAGLGMLTMRAVLRAVLVRLTALEARAPIEGRLRELVADTRADVRAELRRIGLPGHPWSLPLLTLSFLGRERRGRTVERLRHFEVERVVPAARLDELHLVLRSRGIGG
ncbi:MAG TPA: hypothetical protein VGN35_06445 [Jatrophihabitantaceae bacterium]|nr:hypothetical protein [Jatrophihabitantaceae bacterium]